MHGLAILKYENSEVFVASLSNFAPESNSTIILHFLSTRIFEKLFNPFVKYQFPIWKCPTELKIFGSGHTLVRGHS